MTSNARVNLVALLARDGAITSSWVRSAFLSVPREAFVPRYYSSDGEGRRILVDCDDPLTVAQWRHGVYTDSALTTQLTPSAGVTDPDGLPTSSSSMPSVMAGMLEAMNLQPGHRVLEVGTGTGYNTALLCHRVGAENVTTVELDSDIAAAARRSLAVLGMRPHALVGDATELPDATGEFDRIIATAAIDHVPAVWVHHLKPGGILVANLRGSLAGGIVTLAHDEVDVLTGHFLGMAGAFMPMRHGGKIDRGAEDWAVPFDHTNPQRSLTTTDPKLIPHDRSLLFLVQLHLAPRPLRGFIADPEDTELSGRSNDGSWFTADFTPDSTGRYPVAQAGPRRLWDTVERAVAFYREAGNPSITDFGVTAPDHPMSQHVWFGRPDSPWRWPLPL